MLSIYERPFKRERKNFVSVTLLPQPPSIHLIIPSKNTANCEIIRLQFITGIVHFLFQGRAILEVNFH